MLRQKPLYASLLCIVPLGCLYLWQARRASADSDMDYEKWAPSPAALREAVRKDTSRLAGETEEQAHQREFMNLFKSRYREHKPSVAIGLRFMEKNRIKLMVPARMEPWLVDRIAHAAWQETRDLFGHPFDVDIFDTYIGTAPIKIGELRPMEGQPQTAYIVYTYPVKQRRSH